VGSACDVVLNSRWSTLFGMPTSFWGFLTYALLAAIAWNKYADSQWKFAWFVTIVGLLYSLYLTGISFFVLQAACPYCLTSLGLMSAIFVTLFFQKPANLPRFSWGPGWQRRWSGARGCYCASFPLCRLFGKPGSEDPWIRGLAEHLRAPTPNSTGFLVSHCGAEELSAPPGDGFLMSSAPPRAQGRSTPRSATKQG
jgi:hypothetical protein